MQVLTSNFRWLYQLAYSWDGAHLFATSQDGGWDDTGMDRWELGGDGRAETIGGFARARDFGVMPDGRLIVCAHRLETDDAPNMPIVLVVDPSGAEPPWQFPATYFPFEVVVSPLGDRVLVRGHHYQGRGYQPKHRDFLLSYRLPLQHSPKPEWRETIRKLPGGWSADVWSYQFDPSGQRVLSIESTDLAVGPARWVARWRSATTGKSHGKAIQLTNGLAFFPHLVAGGTRCVEVYKETISAYPLSDPSARITRRVKGSRKQFNGIAVHPDGRRVFATNNDGTVREYDAVTLQELRAYEWKVGKLLCVAVAPDGLTAAVGSDTGKVVVWDLE